MRDASDNDRRGRCRERHRRRNERCEDGAHADPAGDLVAKATGKVDPVTVSAALFEAL
jgi:hypothetical protein